MSKKIVKLKESDLNKLVKESVNKILNEMEGSYSIIDVLEQNGVNHNLATAIEGAITYVAGVKNYELLNKMAQYIQDAVDDNKCWDEHKYDEFNS